MDLKEKEIIRTVIEMLKRDYGVDYSKFDECRFYNCLGVIISRELGENEY